jgi:hypothetical protein
MGRVDSRRALAYAQLGHREGARRAVRALLAPGTCPHKSQQGRADECRFYRGSPTSSTSQRGGGRARRVGQWQRPPLGPNRQYPGATRRCHVWRAAITSRAARLASSRVAPPSTVDLSSIKSNARQVKIPLHCRLAWPGRRPLCCRAGSVQVRVAALSRVARCTSAPHSPSASHLLLVAWLGHARRDGPADLALLLGQTTCKDQARALRTLTRYSPAPSARVRTVHAYHGTMATRLNEVRWAARPTMGLS